MEEVYFDNAATTKPAKEVLAVLLQLAEENYANPSSLHDMGLKAELGIKKASKSLAYIINCGHEEIVYTSGGTESNNLAILGGTGSTGKKHVITTTAEHPSVLECFKKLERQGYDVTYLPVTNEGLIDLSELESRINENTALASILHTNNETGAIQDIEAIGAIIKNKNKNTLFHVDTVQSFCKHSINVKKSNIDFLSVSSHKIHGMKGVGALYINSRTNISPMLFGGGQQKNIRPGTENSFGIITFASAADLAFAKIHENYESVNKIKNYIIENIKDMDNIYINSPANASPYILNISFIGIRAEVLLHALGEYNIFISAGSACSSKVKNHSVLKAYGRPKEVVESSVRLSFSHYNTIEEARYFIETINSVVPQLIRTNK